MTNYFLVLSIAIACVATIDSESFSVISSFGDYLVESDEALQFLPHVRRTIFHPGKTKCEEQKREARLAYEEKCSLLGKRFCPDLKTWKAFEQWEIGNGYESKTEPPTTTTQAPTAPHVQTMRTYKTSLYGPVTMRQTHRRPIYQRELVTRNPYA